MGVLRPLFFEDIDSIVRYFERYNQLTLVHFAKYQLLLFISSCICTNLPTPFYLGGILYVYYIVSNPILYQTSLFDIKFHPHVITIAN